jgi:hypothetical protein
MALSASTSGGTQTSTQSPQASAGSGGFGGTAQSGSVQPGTTQSLLTSSGGVPLQNTPVSTVNLSAGTQAQAAKPAASPKHHINPVLIVVPLLLLVVAVGMVGYITASAKKTTDY